MNADSLTNKIPRHVAIIMDGNGRWAESRGLDRIHGHIQGVESVRAVLKAAIRHGVEFLTIYAFSTENWGRPREEVDKLMELLCKSILEESEELAAEGVRMKFIGNLEALPAEVRKTIRENRSEPGTENKVTLVIAVNYSSRWELTEMARKLAQEACKGEIRLEEITAETVSAHLATAGIPDPDLLIRTSGELRLSNFMLWQLSYSELYFTETLWPDFGEEDFDRAMEEYSRRSRRYGLIKK